MQVVSVIWFGSHATIHLGDEHIPVSFSQRDPVQALCGALCEMEKKPKSIRLLFQPADLDYQQVKIPKVGRAGIERCLEESEIPLSDAWGCLVPIPDGKMYYSLLLTESQPLLLRLKQTLAENRIRLLGAWPLVAVIDTLPPFNSLTAPGLAILEYPDATLIYSIDAQKSRSLAMISGEDMHGSAVNTLSQHLALYDVSQLPAIYHLHATTEPSFTASLLPSGSTTELTESQLVSASQKLPLSALSNFIPKQLAESYSFFITSAGVAAFALAFLMAFTYWRDLHNTEALAVSTKEAITKLTGTIQTLENNRELIKANSVFVEEAVPSKLAINALFDYIEGHTPDSIAIRNLSITGDTFVIDGSLFEGVGTQASPYHKFYDGLLSAKGTWKLADNGRLNVAMADFSITGKFIPQSHD
jgi:hypothetical protein